MPTLSTPPTDSRRRDRRALLALGLLSVGLQIPFLSRGISRLDEGSILTIAQSLAEGGVLYRDHATFVGPMIYELMAPLLEQGGGLLAGRLLQAVVFTLCTGLVYALLRQFTSIAWSLAGALSLFPVKALGFPLWTIPNYAQLAVMFALTAVLCATRFVWTPRLSWLIASGFAAGASIVTHQNTGASAGISLSLGVAVATLARSERGLRERVQSMLGYAAVLAVCAATPALLFGVYYGAQGAAADYVDRAWLGLLGVSSAIGVPLPGLDVWSLDPDKLGPASFVYFPTPVLSLAWQGGLNLYSPAIALSVEHAVKFAYYAPLLASLLAIASIASLLRARAVRLAACLTLVAAFGTLSYWSAAYRADWTHLMSVAPALLLMCTVVLQHFATSSFVRYAGRVLFGLWMGAGALTGVAVMLAYRAEVETPHGRLLGPPAEAENTAKLLDYLAAQPKDARIWILPTQPLFYFLSDRSIPARFDLFMPGYLRPGDDARLAAELADADRIIYDPNPMPTLPIPLAQYAPAAAAAMVDGFRFTQAVSPTAYVMEPSKDEARPGVTVVDLYARLESQPKQLPPDVSAGGWMMYRVIETSLRRNASPTCFSFPHRVAEGELLSFLPLTQPATWIGAGAQVTARHSVSLRAQGEPTMRLFSELHSGFPSETVELSLASAAGRRVAIEFCIQAAQKRSPLEGRLQAGWGELKIVRRPLSGDGID